MISETRFAKRYNSHWRSLAPTMELFIRKCNLSLYNRSWPELESTSAPHARALINQTAFELFCRGYEAPGGISKYLDYIVQDENIVLAEQAVMGISILDAPEKAEASELARRMLLHFDHSKKASLEIRPRFKGCGIINSCTGDVLQATSSIVEFKDGDRAFRSYEFRQVSIYAALFLNQVGEAPSSVEVVNSRRGVSVKLAVDKFADEVAGQSAIDYLREVVRVISDESMSR